MDEYFSFGTTDEEPIADYRVNDLVAAAEDAPTQESMRGQRRITNAPSTDQKAVRRRMIHRSGGHLDENDWDSNLSRIDAIHRGIGLHLPPDLHRFVHDKKIPVEDRAHALLGHVSGERDRVSNGGKDHREGLGPHWTSEQSVGESFAEDDAQYRANQKHPSDDPKDFSWGRSKGDIDDDELHEHLVNDHGAREDLMENNRKVAPDNEWMLQAHEHVHKNAPDDEHLKSFREPEVAHGQPATAVVLHGPTPMREDINDHPEGEGGMVYNWEDHGEKEINLHKGAEVPVTGISWAPIRSEDAPDKEWLPEYTHHTFSTPQGHHASKTYDDLCENCHQPIRETGYPEAPFVHHPSGNSFCDVNDAKDAVFWRGAPGRSEAEPMFNKTATVIPTRVERLEKGNTIRTPTGQSVKVHRVRPHESDSSLVYLDTEMGTSTVKKGTELQSVPVNTQQQEMPDTGNPVNDANTGQLPGSGRTPAGPGAGASGKPASQGACPNCGNSGTLHLQGSSYVCSVCGYTVGSGGTPGGLLFTNQPHGFAPTRRKPGQTNIQNYAAKYQTTDGISQIARRARQVLGGEQ